MSAFLPGTTYSLTFTGSSQRVQLWTAPPGVIENYKIMVVNNTTGGAIGWLNVGSVTVVAAIIASGSNGPSWPIAFGATQFFSINQANNYLAYIGTAGAFSV